MSENLKSSQKDYWYFEKLQFFLIAIHESADTTNMAQQTVFVPKIKEDFHVLEEFVELISIKNTPIGVNILRALFHYLEAKKLRN